MILVSLKASSLNTIFQHSVNRLGLVTCGFTHPLGRPAGGRGQHDIHSELHKYLEMCKESLFYCDTDSVITACKLPTSKKLGGLKLEGKGEFTALLPKTYAFGSKVKLKGFENQKITKEMVISFP